MSKIIKEYYEKVGVIPILIESKLELFARNKDIEEEFEFWITNNKFLDNINIEGYTASNVAAISPYLKGEGSFLLLIELRDNPDKAKRRIEKGFQIK